jgi:hypothetical protein
VVRAAATEAEALVSDNRDVTTARQDTLSGTGTLPVYLPPAEPAITGPGHRLGDVARVVLAAAVPRFADAAGMFVLEELLSGGAPPGQASQAAGSPMVVRRLGTGFARDGRMGTEAAFPSGEVTAFAADSVCARCVRDGVPVIFGWPDSTTLPWVSPGARSVLARYESCLVAPTTAGGTPIGFLIAARRAGAPEFRDADVVPLAGLADHAAAGIASYLGFLRQQSAADALRPRLPAVSGYALGGLEIAARCLPAAGCAIGGDWYDVIRLPAGRVGIVVGDVMGHGTQAAAVMAQLSAAAYALADLDLPPAEVLRQLNRTALALPQAALATCAYAVIDPGSRSCTLATAGHLPPVLAMPDGSTRVPGIPGGQSLGVGATRYGQARVRLRPGSTLALYTDGLVETRTRPFDQGILALRSVLARARHRLEDVCEDLLRPLGERYEDDITVVLARIPSSG